MKQFKRILCLLTAVMVCLSLTGCNDLDEMRAAHAIRQEDGTILWNGYTYRMLEGDYTYLNSKGDQTVYVTDPDVPLLLSRIEGSYHSASVNGLLIGDGYYAEDTVFCREDHYEWTQNAIHTGFEVQNYSYCLWDDIESKQKYFSLSNAEREAVDRWLTLPSTTENDENWGYCFTICGYSKYTIFVKSVCSVLWDGSAYVLREETENTVSKHYRVPESEWALLDKLNGTRPETFVLNDVVEGEPIYTTCSTIATQVSTTKSMTP